MSQENVEIVRRYVGGVSSGTTRSSGLLVL